MTRELFGMRMLILFVTVIGLSAPSFASLSNKGDGEWVTVTGKVTSVKPDYFNLKYNDKSIIVEMDDFDMDADGYKLVKGDNVVVYGRVDQDFLENKKIEASSVYVKSIDSYFYASSIDEESIPIATTSYYVLSPLPDGASVDIKGTVINVDDREFTVNTGLRLIEVNTEDMALNPMDNKGLIKISKGDRVFVSGVIEDSYFDNKELAAKYIIEYSD